MHCLYVTTSLLLVSPCFFQITFTQNFKEWKKSFINIKQCPFYKFSFKRIHISINITQNVLQAFYHIFPSQSHLICLPIALLSPDWESGNLSPAYLVLAECLLPIGPLIFRHFFQNAWSTRSKSEAPIIPIIPQKHIG